MDCHEKALDPEDRFSQDKSQLSYTFLSLQDLLQIPTGGLAASLRKVIKFATKHVYSCRLCCQKGFICELCNNSKVIYAFETDATYRVS